MAFHSLERIFQSRVQVCVSRGVDLCDDIPKRILDARGESVSTGKVRHYCQSNFSEGLWSRIRLTACTAPPMNYLSVISPFFFFNSKNLFFQKKESKMIFFQQIW